MRRRRFEAELAEFKKRLEAEALARKKALEAEVLAQKKVFDAEAARFKREQEERDRAFDQRFQQVAGDADNRWGALAEGLVGHDLLELLRSAGLDVLSVAPGQPIERNGETREYDLVAFGVHDSVVVEVKSTLRRADVTRFRKRLRDFRTWCPEHARPRVLGAMACLTAEETALRAAEASGFYVIRAIDATARILNAEGFRPIIY